MFPKRYALVVVALIAALLLVVAQPLAVTTYTRDIVSARDGGIVGSTQCTGVTGIKDAYGSGESIAFTANLRAKFFQPTNTLIQPIGMNYRSVVMLAFDTVNPFNSAGKILQCPSQTILAGGTLDSAVSGSFVWPHTGATTIRVTVLAGYSWSWKNMLTLTCTDHSEVALVGSFTTAVNNVVAPPTDPSVIINPPDDDNNPDTAPPALANSPPIADIRFVSGSGLTFTVSADGSGDGDGSITSYQWYCGDKVATGPSATFTMPSAGTYGVGLMVTDDDGDYDRASMAINLPISADITIDPEGGSDGGASDTYIEASSMSFSAVLTVLLGCLAAAALIVAPLGLSPRMKFLMAAGVVGLSLLLAWLWFGGI